MDRYRLFLLNLSRWPWRATLRTLAARFKEDRLGVTAGSLTFTTVFALVPLLTVGLALFTAFPVFGKFRQSLETQFVGSLVPDFIAKKVLVMLTSFSAKASQLGGTSMIALGVTAMMLMLTIDHTLNAIWRVKHKRSIARRIMTYWAALTLGPLLLGVSLSTTSYLMSVSRGWAVGLPGGVEFLLSTFVFCLQVGAFASLFKYVPNTSVRWEHALAGALYVAIGMVVVDKGLALYLSQVRVYTTIYGAFSALPIFLIWIFVSWLIVLQGAVVAAYAPSLLSQVNAWSDGPGWRFRLSLAVMQTLVNLREQGRPGATVHRLARRLKVDPLQLQTCLDALQGMGWIGRLEENEDHDGGRYVMLCDPARTALRPLAEATLLASDGWSAPFWQRTGLREMTLAQALENAAGSSAVVETPSGLPA